MNYIEKFKEENPVAYITIDNAIKNNKMGHAYLLSSEANREIVNEYLYFVQALISDKELRDPNSYPDLTILDGSTSLIKKADVSSAVENLYQTPLDQTGKKFLIIKNIENTNKQSINSLLKFIEEPTKNTYIIMTTNRISAVIDTIKSRSQIVKLRNIDKRVLETEIAESQIPNSKILSRISNSVENAKNISSEVQDKIPKIIDALSEAIITPDSLVSNLQPLVNKSSYVVVLDLLKEFFSDIWREENLLDVTFSNHTELIQKYILSNFDFSKAIASINEFIFRQNHYVSFELAKNKLFIELGESYV